MVYSFGKKELKLHGKKKIILFTGTLFFKNKVFIFYQLDSIKNQVIIYFVEDEEIEFMCITNSRMNKYLILSVEHGVNIKGVFG